jgi:hypothetical protein
MPAFRTRDNQSRTLEVITDTPLLTPTLAIISPTPRAFTFPISHNLTDSPYSSPSNSPFESELTPLALSCTTPPHLIRTLSSPDSSLISASPPPSTHKRRKSSCGSDLERRPKKGDEDYIKRPENAFILFRRKCCEDRQQAQDDAAVEGPTKKQRQADLSKTISQQWKGLSTEERQYWEQLAKEKKREHEQMYPNYVYRPQRSREKDSRSKSRKPKFRRGEVDNETDSESVSFVLPMVHQARHHGRSASAPTPPLPYQSIQIPNVYHLTPSCPTSPSLLPMISRRSSHPGHAEDDMSNFDFLPNDTVMAPPFGQAGPFEASIQSSEFLRSMFSMPGPQAITHQNELTLLNGPPISHDSTILLPDHQVMSCSQSIGSGSSGPSSPSSGPFTPSGALCHSFSLLNPSGDHIRQHPHHDGFASEPQTQAEFDLQMQLQLQRELELSSYAWQNNSMWQEGTGILLGNDFDLNSIPPIELGLPKLDDDMGLIESSMNLSDYQECGSPMENRKFQEESQNLDGLLGFEEMMAGHGF